MIRFIKNTGEYFASNYFDEDFTSKVLSKTGYNNEDIKEFNKKISPLKDKYFRFKQLFIEGRLRNKDKVYETHQFHAQLLNALGFEGDKNEYNNLFHLSENDVIPVRQTLYRGVRPHLMIMEMQALIKEDDIDPDGLFEQRYNIEEEEVTNPPQKYHRSQWEKVFQVPQDVRLSPSIIKDAIFNLFTLEAHYRPKYVLLLAGNIVYLLEEEKWKRGSYLEFDIEELFSEATANKSSNYYALFYFLIGKETLAPDSNMVLLDQLDEDSHKSAYEVTKDLKEGIIHAVEALANEALFYQKNKLNEEFDETDDIFEQQMKDDCLRIIYRLLFIFYAESREDLDILPSNDPIYNKGYSLEMLRELEQVPLYSENSRDGYFFHDSISKLFSVLSSGYREKENGNNESFKVRHIDSPIFDDRKMHHLHKVKFRNKVWQDIICRLSLSREQKGKTRGRISYANLGINQLGSVYESLLAFRGFYAEQDYIEVHKKGKPEEGTYLVPRHRRDDFENGEILKDEKHQDVIIKKGTFVYRLSGRDRQKSASYYTPEVLTQSTVKYTLKPFVEKLENGEMKALDLLDLKLLEPAMGAAAFHNEMINQLAETYINYRQKELRDSGKKEWKIEPDKFKEELQKVKAYIATHNVYGVDLNPTAIELGKLSLWLNVIHKDMETPFFSNRICVGNAVVGAWLKVYPEKELLVDLDSSGSPAKKQTKKEWWDKAPRQIAFSPGKDYSKIKTDRKPNEIYHFLLPDKNMLASAGIKLLKAEHENEVKKISDWKKEWIKPLNKSEVERVKRISNSIDDLLTEYYKFQRTVNAQTASKNNIFGLVEIPDEGQQSQLLLQNYDEKERLADQRNRHSSPYYKLKMVMDYWCSLWFWDMRDALELPERHQFWQDIEDIIGVDTAKAVDGIIEKRGQQLMFESSTQLSLAIDSARDTENDKTESLSFVEVAIEYTNKKDLYDNNQRLGLVHNLATKYFFFHPQLEFLEVFWERGGFDLIAGNPPWLKLTFEEKGIITEKFPEVDIRSVTAPQVRQMQESYLNDFAQKEGYIDEWIGTECAGIFMNAIQNYPFLKGQQTNLYKCVLENGFSLLNKNGFMGLIHPESIYDDPSGKFLRKEVYQRLRYHFQYTNELSLFAEVHHNTVYGTQIYSGEKSDVEFYSISNLFHPSTIDGCFIQNQGGINSGIKVKDEASGKYVWNIKPHSDRIVKFTEVELNILSRTFENSHDWQSAKLVCIHSSTIVDILQKLSTFNKSVLDTENKITMCWDETNDVNGGTIKRGTIFPNIEEFEMIYSGPHFFVSNPIYKTPTINCKLNSDYNIVELTNIDSEFMSRTNYIPVLDKTSFGTKIIGFVDVKNQKNDFWIDYYKLGFRKMLSQGGERTLTSAILPPMTSHTNGVVSIIFKNNPSLIEFTGLSSSLVLDFFIKTIGASNLTDSRLTALPLGIDEKYKTELFVRTLQLNCLNTYYSKLWEQGWREEFKDVLWSIVDSRLKPFNSLSSIWDWSTPLRNWFERRQALVEIDVITAIALGLNLEELILIYNVQFPVLQQNEDDTWYDTKGNIVFTCSKGLVGVGVDRAVWDQIRSLKEGESYEHTIEKSELYHGQKITYYAPFDKCDRVEDYKVAWLHFEEIFKEK